MDSKYTVRGEAATGWETTRTAGSLGEALGIAEDLRAVFDLDNGPKAVCVFEDGVALAAWGADAPNGAWEAVAPEER